jgi:hypothetical protein
MAAILNIDSNLADFATVSATGKKIGLERLSKDLMRRRRRYSAV